MFRTGDSSKARKARRFQPGSMLFFFEPLRRFFDLQEKLDLLHYSLRWVLISIVVGIPVGLASAFFLFSLDLMTRTREAFPALILLLPAAGATVAYLYHRWGSSVERGNNLILEEIHDPKKVIPLRMAPLVLIGTLLTHLFGGSAGREGTAVQMGASIADQLTPFLRFKAEDRRLILIAGMSAGFASVFGTPLAGAIFGLEVYFLGRIEYNAILPSFSAAVIAHLTALAVGTPHTHYHVHHAPAMDGWLALYTFFAGICFGLAGWLFSSLTHQIKKLMGHYIVNPPLRAAAGGLLVIAGVAAVGTDYIGLGIPMIVRSFEQELPPLAFLLKTVFTAVTLGSGFRGGEVTPLFFIGSSLGNALSSIIPLPMDLLAAMGFVAVFAGAANTPLACTLMAVELFGAEAGFYAGLASVVAYIFSGNSGIYTSQIVTGSKGSRYKHKVGPETHDRLQGRSSFSSKTRKSKWMVSAQSFSNGRLHG